MTNEEQAREIASGFVISDFSVAHESALEMAEQKDAQFKEYLEKKKDNYVHHREMWQLDTFEYCCYDSQIDTIEEIINELFGVE